MKKYAAICFFFFMALLIWAGNVYAQQGGFTGPKVPSANIAQTWYQAVTVSQLQTLPNNKSYVTLTGNITQFSGRKNYTFKDTTGEITLSIDEHNWWGLTVGPSDRVQLLVEIEKKRNGRVEVEAKGIRKL